MATHLVLIPFIHLLLLSFIANSNNFNTPIKIKDDDIVHLRLFDKTGRGGNNIKVNK